MSQENEKDANYLSLRESGFAGATTGFVTRLVCQPLDVLKIRFQLQITPIRRGYENSKYTSVLQAVQTICKEEGVSALWKGHVPAQYLSIIFGGIQFATYNRLTNIVEKNRPYGKTWVEPALHFSNGAIAGLLAIVSSFPFDVVRTRLIAQGEPKMYHGVVDAVFKIWKNEGLNGCLRGLLPACIQTAPLAGLTFGFHNIYQVFWLRTVQKVENNGAETISTTGSLITGMGAGLSGKLIVYPLDLIKKRLQIQGVDEEKTLFKKVLHCQGVVQCFILTVRTEGYLGLLKGFFPSMIKAGATNAIYFTVYDKVCQLIIYAKR